MKKTMILKTAGVAVAGLMMMGCSTPQYQENPSTFNQAAIGAALGAIAGGIIGNNSHGAFGNGEGAVAGAAIGGLLGGAMGHQTDKSNTQMGHMNAQVNAANEAANTTIVNVKNSNGSYTPVTLRRVGNQYAGPRGEYYPSMPTEDQLKIAYGF
ncbi:MAG: glycine zipper domain-containing protein [bacterium]